MHRYLTSLIQSAPWGDAIDLLLAAMAEAQREHGDPPIDAESIVDGCRFVDAYEAAARAKYPSGRNKRTRYKPVDLSRRQVVVMLHAMGFERARTSSRWPLVTCHRAVVRDDGDAYIQRLHPVTTRLVAGNAVDRSPWHGVHIEVEGNYASPEGKYWAGDRMGRSVLDEDMRDAARAAVVDLIREVEDRGGEVVAVMPHRVTGRGSNGRPNRPLCPGHEIWSQVGEWSARYLDLALPGPDFAMGGLTIPDSWHGEHWRGGEGLTLL